MRTYSSNSIPENHAPEGDRDRLKELLSIGRNLRSKRAPADWRPRFDVKVTAKEVTALIDIPGIDEDDIRIGVEGCLLTIAGERDFDHDNEDAEEFTVIERPYGAYLVEIELPTRVDPSQIKAKYKRGVLKVQMPVARAA